MTRSNSLAYDELGGCQNHFFLEPFRVWVGVVEREVIVMILQLVGMEQYEMTICDWYSSFFFFFFKFVRDQIMDLIKSSQLSFQFDSLFLPNPKIEETLKEILVINACIVKGTIYRPTFWSHELERYLVLVDRVDKAH